MYLDLNTSYKRKMKKIFVIIFAIVISLSFTMCGTDDSDISGSEDPTTQKNQFEGGSVETDECIFKIKDVKIADPSEVWDEEDPRIIVTYEYTNKTEETQEPVQIWYQLMKVQQDTGDAYIDLRDDIAPSAEAYKDANDNSRAEIKPGKTVDCVIVYELKDTKSPVIFTVMNSLDGDNIGTYTVKLKK